MASFWYYLVNGLTVGFILAPLIITLWACRNRSFGRGLQLFLGIGFIAFSGIAFAWLTDGLARFEGATTASEEEITLKADVLQAFGVWVFVLPATYLGIGVNLMSNFISSCGTRA